MSESKIKRITFELTHDLEMNQFTMRSPKKIARLQVEFSTGSPLIISGSEAEKLETKLREVLDPFRS